jgi:hypothetical protein
MWLEPRRRLRLLRRRPRWRRRRRAFSGYRFGGFRNYVSGFS